MQPYYNNNNNYADPNYQMYNQNQQYYDQNQMGFQQQPQQYQQQPDYFQQGIPLNYPPPTHQQQQEYMYQDQQNIHVKSEVNNNPYQVIAKPNYLQDELKTTTHSSHPTEVLCINCQKAITTIIQYQIGLGTWTMVLLFLCCFWPLMCLPCCLNSMKDVVHYCPVCGAFCGQRKFLC